MSRSHATLAAVLITVVLAAGCGNENDDHAATIAAASEAFASAYCEGDTAALASFYTRDAVLQPPDRVVRGRGEIAEFLALDPGEVRQAFEVASDALTIDGDVAVDRGTWTRTRSVDGGDPVTDSSHYLAVWNLQPDGTWLMSQNMWHAPATEKATGTGE